MIARKSALIIFINLVNGLLGYIAIFLVARFMDTPDYALGVVSFAYGFVSLFHIFDNLGFHEAHVKKISEGKDIGICIGSFASIKIVLTILMTFLLISSVLSWKFILNRGFESTEHELAIYILLIYFILWSLTSTFIYTYRGKKQIAKAQIPFLIETIGRVLATAFVIFSGLGIIALAFTYVIGEIGLLITAILFFRGYPIKKPSLEYIKLYYKFAFPLAIVGASSKIMTNLDKVLIQLFWNASEGGNYFAIYRLSKFIDMSSIALGMLLFPTISALYAKNNIQDIKTLSIRSERYLSMAIFPIVFFMAFNAQAIIHILLSNRFYSAIPILQILPFFALFDALGRPYQMKLLGMNMPHFSRNRIVIMVTANLILNIILIPKDIQSLGLTLGGYGAIGAAIATVIAYFIGLVYTRIMVWKISRININYRIFLHLFAAASMGLILQQINNYLYLISRWYDLIIFGLLGLIIYFSILYVLNEFSKKDFLFFIDILNIKKMFSYIRDELKEK